MAPRPRLRVGLGTAVVLIVFGVAVAVLVSLVSAGGSTQRVGQGPNSSPRATAAAPEAGLAAGAEAGTASSAHLYVHLVGAVARPGLYQLRAGSRAIDAVAAAGGFAPDADRAPLNLARLLSDGEQIVVPVVGQAPSVSPLGGDPVADAKVNLNTADATALDTLPGVGPATAKDILDWRKKNGRFSALEDLLSVGGIGEKTLAQLKDRVTL